MLSNSPTNWGSVSKTLHWLTVLLIMAAVTMGWVAELWPVSLDKINLFVWHKSIGITILGLVVVRLVWKMLNPVPGAASGISKTNHRLATLGHWALYGILLAMPLSGWILNSAANFPFKWVGLAAVPNLIEPNEVIQGQAEQVHFMLFLALSALVLGHAVAAIWHHTSHKSNLLLRMLPEPFTPGGQSGRPVQLYSILGILLLLGGSLVSWALSQPGEETRSAIAAVPMAAAGQQSATTPDPVPPGADSGRPWTIDPEQSRLGFTGLYAGVEFDGEFGEFSATMIFDPENPETGLFDVTINTTSINTNSADRDSMMPEQDWFHFESFPSATYLTSQFSVTGPEQYLANGTLSIKGIERRIDLPFKWTIDNNGIAHMTAETAINRMDFGLGARDWADDDTIGFEVVVKIDLQLTE